MPKWALLLIAGIMVVAYATLALGYGWFNLSGENNAAIPDIFEAGMRNPLPDGAPIDQRMLAAQEALAGFASWMFMLGLATTVVTAGGTIALIWQIRQTREALGEARRGNEIADQRNRMEMRAYLAVDAVFTIYNDQRRPEGFTITLRNTGKTPVVWCEVAISLYAVDSEFLPTGMGSVEEELALGPQSEVRLHLDRRDIDQEQWHRHWGGGCGIKLDVECLYIDIFGDHQHANISKWRAGPSAALSYAAEGNTFT